MAFTFKHGDQPLDGYTIQRGVGRGGFGEVYYAVSDSGKEVALKYLRDNPQIELRGVAHCLNLKSPHLVTIYDVKQNADGDYFVIMEYVAGPSLRDLLADCTGGLGVPKAAYFLREIARGLSYLHERGIVHRDLKPGNLFYEDGYVKIGDYGLSKFVSASRHSAQTVSVGTVHYMAPEIGTGQYHPGTDIYALGVMLYEMLLGRVPFEGSSMGEVLMKHLTQQPEVDELPEPFPRVIRKALAKDPNDRYASVQQMVAEAFENPRIEQSVAGFDAGSLTMVAAHAYQHAPPATPAATAEGSSQVDGIAGKLRERAEHAARQIDAAVARHVPNTSLPSGTGRDRKSKLLLTVVIGIGLACVAAGFGSRLEESGVTVMRAVATLSAIAFGALFGTLFVAPRLQADNDWLDRLVVVGCAAPALLVAYLILHMLRTPVGVPLFAEPVSLTDLLQGAMFQTVLIVLFFGDWPGRVRSGQRGELSFSSAISIAIFAFIVSQIFDHGSTAMMAGVAAAASLTVQVLASIWAAHEPVVPIAKASGSSLATAPFAPAAVSDPTAAAATQRRSLREAVHARLTKSTPAASRASKSEDAFGLRIATAAFLAGTVFFGVLSIAAVGEDGEIPWALIGLSAACLPFAAVFAVESWKVGHEARAARNAARMRERVAQRSQRWRIGAYFAGGCSFILGWILIALGIDGHEDEMIVIGNMFMWAGLITVGVLLWLRWRRRRTPRATVPAAWSTTSQRPMGVRIAWRFVAAGLLTTAIVSLGIAAFGGLRYQDELAAAFSIAFGALVLMIFALYKSTPTRRFGLWAETVRPFLLTVLVGVAGIACVLMIAFGGQPYADESFLVAFGLFVGALVFGIFVYRLRGDDAPTQQAGEAPSGSESTMQRRPLDETVTMINRGNT